MFTLPQLSPHGNQALPTGLSCPDCHGVLGATATGRRRRLVLVCRIGHSYSLSEFLIAVEERLDLSLRMAMLAEQELHDVLDDLHGRARRQQLGLAGPLFAERRERARVSTVLLRDVIDHNRAIEIVDEMDGVQLDGDSH